MKVMLTSLSKTNRSIDMRKIFIIAVMACFAAVSCDIVPPEKTQELETPPALFRLRCSANDITTTSETIKVSWSKYINHEGYELILSDSTSVETPETIHKTVVTKEKSHTFEGLTPGTDYRIWIRALNFTWGVVSEYTTWGTISTDEE